METQKPLLKDEGGKEVDVHMYRKPIRKVTKVPQPSDPMEHVVDEAIHKELGDSLVRAATTSSSLGAEQDSGDTTAQNRFESVSKHSNDSLLARGNTLQSDEDRMKLNELMALCINLQNRVLEFKKIKTSQHNKIASLKRMVKKLEKRNRSSKVESLDDKESGEEVFAAAGQNENVANITTEELTLTQSLEALNTSKPKNRVGKRKRKESRRRDDTKEYKKQKVEDEKEIDELKQLMETIPDEEEVAIDAISLVVKSSSIVDWKIYKEGKKSYYQIVKADGKS
nr:hypothetical protein [Tanacetum cinerariifolium]